MLTKAQRMDKKIKSEPAITVSSLERIVFEVFGISLQRLANDPKTPAARRSQAFFSKWREKEWQAAGKEELLEYALATLPDAVHGETVRQVINDVYRVNLSGISELEASTFSLFSKGRWIKQKEDDLFVLNTGSSDTEVTVSLTDHYVKKTGASALPAGLCEELETLGYFHIPEKNQLYYFSPDGLPVDDAFKKQTIDALEHAGQQI